MQDEEEDMWDYEPYPPRSDADCSRQALRVSSVGPGRLLPPLNEEECVQDVPSNWLQAEMGAVFDTRSAD